MKIVVVTGSRKAPLEQRKLVWRVLDEFEPDLIVHGASTGVDHFADNYARKYKVPCLRFPADWDDHGPPAGPIRNRKMCDTVCQFADPHHEVIGLIFPGGTGTADCAKQMARCGFTTHHIE